MKIDKPNIDEILTKIYGSDHFSAELDRKLLSYLIEAHLSGKTPKEIDIAKDLFHKDGDFNPIDSSIVRTHIYSLRKKLDIYYLSEGANDKIRIQLQKGHYKIEFLTTSEPKNPKRIKWNQYFTFALIVILILSFFSFHFWQKSNSWEKQIKNLSLEQENNPVWADFLSSELPTLLVIGDYYVYQRPHKLTSSEQFIRDVEINSKDDFEKYLRRNPEAKGQYIQTPLTYLGMEVPYVVSRLTKVFSGDENRLKIKLASDLVWQDVQKNNIIYIGSEKSLRIMSSFLEQLRFKINLFPHKIFYTPNYKDTVETITLESYYRYGFHDDFPIVAKFPTTDKNIVMLMVSFSSFGRVEAIKELTTPAFPKILQNKHFIQNEVPYYFEILFKVHGIERSGFDTEVLHFHEITSKVIVENKR
jgi:hypothetical protein